MHADYSRRNFVSAFCRGLCLSAVGPWLVGCDERPGGASKRGEIKFKDLAGHEIILDKPAEGIVDTVGSTAALAIAVHGSPSRLAGIHPFTRAMFEKSFISRIFPEVLQIPSDVVTGSYTPNVERIASLNPDIVIHWGDYGEATATPLRNAGLTVATYRALPGGAEETLYAFAKMLGDMIGDNSRSTYLRELADLVRTHVGASLPAIPEEQRTRALIVTVAGAGLSASGGDASSIYSYHLYRAGGINVASALPDFSAVSPEQIANWNPDVVFVFNSQGASLERIYADPILGATKAARTRRVYVLPIGSHCWGSLGPEDPLVQTWMAELFYPEWMDRSVRGRMRNAYERLFGRRFTECELDEVLLMSTNGQSSSYERFAQT
ncbi:MAG: ABC transporter substrate-binding protein [Mesorhizobium sp.]|uniref:ABC transporter substrate-binding protein n=1 Tax=Mesorhizobium sp. TaxID=1871066 RepID=UPI000FE51A92|nr:ABC transporter substrate-binding protein [Mesorhizobium sp.]RWL91649.1 MAG: ABC transporter substrate-binding protein [Mesorhizobium sp.]TIP50147.1 MAG: ABC transporter substrate-binding protein [Mesorhizobium sp.]TJV70222.1 MAG: ABC transporter substrate-binding protein [Mesorhizobium sp.]